MNQDTVASRARVAADGRNFGEARRLAAEILASAPADIGTLDLLAEIAESTGESAAYAASMRRAIAHRPEDATLRRRLGELMRTRGDATGASLHARFACELAPNSPEAWLEAGRCARLLQQNTEAEAHLARALELATDAADAAESGLELAKLFIVTNRPNEAVQLLQRVCRDAPTAWEPRARLAMALSACAQLGYPVDTDAIIAEATAARALFTTQPPRSALASAAEASPQTLYLDLMKRVLTDLVYDAPEALPMRLEGLDWPTRAHTMIGYRALQQLQVAIETALAGGVRGDLVETGVWRGGATIFMRAVLKAHDVRDRAVWVCDSFRGFPPESRAAAGMSEADRRFVAVPRAEVEGNFARYGLLDAQVHFVEGWFDETLPQAPIERIAVLRLDGDLYESTMSALQALYDKVSPGGFVIVDDYGSVPACWRAVETFRRERSITAPMHFINWQAVYWRKS